MSSNVMFPLFLLLGALLLFVILPLTSNSGMYP